MQSIANHFWAIVPAGGTGQRMGAGQPKQYLPLEGKSVIDHTIEVLLAESRLDCVLVGISDTDTAWLETLSRNHPRVFRFSGGVERTNTVLNGIYALISEHNAQQDDWVLVHDAVRPCLRPLDLANLIEACMTSGDGGILATPVVDTIKRVDVDFQVIKTENRAGLWRALTPQMFQLGALQEALEAGLRNDANCTDEAQAMELIGHPVSIIAGNPSNIKITRPADLELAAFYLKR